MRRFGAIAVLVTCALGGCIVQARNQEFGGKVDADAIARIEPGKTTRAEVEGMLGPPVEEVKTEDGVQALYRHVRSKETTVFVLLHAESRKTQEVRITYGEDGIVTVVRATWDTEQTGPAGR